MAEKTPWKKIVSDPNYLGEADFDDGEEKIATIAKIVDNVEIKTAEGTSQKPVVYFVEPLKPMILNVSRSKAIEKVTGSRFLEDWVGAKVQLYIQDNIKAFGELVSAVRVRPRKPVEKKAVVCEHCGQPINGGGGKSPEYIAAYTKKQYGAALCWNCAMAQAEEKRKEAAADVPTETDG